MYGERPLLDTMRVARAWATNQVARFAPASYLRITGQTGRGARDAETVQGIADYFERTFYEYFDVLGIARDAIEGFLEDRRVLEYGPGDIPGVALLMLGYGAQKAYCVDRFPMMRLSADNERVIEAVLRKLPPERRARADLRRVDYLVRPSGLSGLHGAVDFAYSRAVLEHVDNVQATFSDMADAMRPGALAIHLVDLKSHGLHRRNPLDFLSWPQSLWQTMYSHKGVPNRWRIDQYRRALAHSGLEVVHLAPTALATAEDIAEVRPHLAAAFRDLPDEDLRWLGFWLVCAKGRA